MDDLGAVCWAEGLFLQPQHFQITDRWYEAGISALRDVSAPYLWGIKEITLSREYLANGVCGIDRLDAVLPGGVRLTVPGNAFVIPRKIEEQWLSADKPYSLYLCIQKAQPSDNVTRINRLEDLREVKTRYVSLAQPATIRNLYLGDDTAQVPLVHHVIRLAGEKEEDILGESEVLPFAQVVKEGSSIVFSETYIPPVLCIGASTHLMELAKNLRDELAGRMRQLDIYKGVLRRRRELDTVALQHLLGLRSLAKYVPLMTHYVRTEQLHPWMLYGLVLSILGELSTFGSDLGDVVDVEGVKEGTGAYVHTDLAKCFGTACMRIQKYLDEITLGAQYTVPMTERDGVYFAELPARFFERPYEFYLLIKSMENPDSYLGSVLGTGKLSSFDQVRVLTEKALPGLKLEAASTPPGLPDESDSVYVRLVRAGPHWAAIEGQRRIGLLWPDAPAGTTISVVVVRG